MAEIIAKNGERIIVDDADFSALSALKWHLDEDGYAKRNIRKADGKQAPIRMHRQIVGFPLGFGLRVDHINGDRLDNRRENLRICTHADNTRNRKIPKNNATGFKGVSFNKEKQKFTAKIGLGKKGRAKHLGQFDTAELAHEFYCLAADLLYGEFANYG